MAGPSCPLIFTANAAPFGSVAGVGKEEKQLLWEFARVFW